MVLFPNLKVTPTVRQSRTCLRWHPLMLEKRFSSLPLAVGYSVDLEESILVHCFTRLYLLGTLVGGLDLVWLESSVFGGTKEQNIPTRSLHTNPHFFHFFLFLGLQSVVLWVFLSILLLAGIAVIAPVYLYRRRCLSRFHKPETSPAAGYLHTR